MAALARVLVQCNGDLQRWDGGAFLSQWTSSLSPWHNSAVPHVEDDVEEISHGPAYYRSAPYTTSMTLTPARLVNFE